MALASVLVTAFSGHTRAGVHAVLPGAAAKFTPSVHAMQSLGFESKNPTIYQMIADLDKEGQVPQRCARILAQ